MDAVMNRHSEGMVVVVVVVVMEAVPMHGGEELNRKPPKRGTKNMKLPKGKVKRVDQIPGVCRMIGFYRNTGWRLLRRRRVALVAWAGRRLCSYIWWIDRVQLYNWHSMLPRVPETLWGGWG